MFAKHVFASLHTRLLLLSMLVVALLMSSFLTASAQSSVYLPQITNQSQPPQAGPLPEDTSDVEQQPLAEPEVMPDGGPQMPAANEEAPVSAAAYQAPNWNVANRVGVGTDLPAHRLTVSGGQLWTTSNWLGSVGLDNASAIGWQANNSGFKGGLGRSTGGFYFFRTTSNLGAATSAPIYDMVINDAGYVGLGTTKPAHHLSIAGGPLWTTDGWAGAVGLTNGSAIGWQANGVGNKAGFGHTTGGFSFFRTTSNLGATTSAPIYDMVINDAGKVGIGTPDPGYTLDVNGQIHTSDYIVAEGDIHAGGNINADGYVYAGSDIYANGAINAGGGISTASDFYAHNIKLSVPDYVFEPDYPLLSLDQLRAYVEQEKHLPNVPDAAQIHQGGLNLSEFQMKLLEKTEELTLYTLAQDKQLTTQQQEIAALQQRLDALEAKK